MSVFVASIAGSPATHPSRSSRTSRSSWKSSCGHSDHRDRAYRPIDSFKIVGEARGVAAGKGISAARTVLPLSLVRMRTTTTGLDYTRAKKITSRRQVLKVYELNAIP